MEDGQRVSLDDTAEVSRKVVVAEGGGGVALRGEERLGGREGGQDGGHFHSHRCMTDSRTRS